MVGMVNEANDMWAAATVLFQLLMSGYPEWESKSGLFMFGPTDAALVTANRLPDRGQKWKEVMQEKIMTAQKLWVRLWLYDQFSAAAISACGSAVLHAFAILLS